MQQLDEQFRPYAEALVAALKQEGSLSQPLVEAAFRSVPRHVFLDSFLRRERREGTWQVQEIRPSSFPSPDAWLQAVYVNEALTTAYSPEGMAISSSSSPDAIACMLEASELERGLCVLEIGTGTGYNAALLASIVGSQGHVWTVEVDADLAQSAVRRLRSVAGSRVSVQVGNGLEGYAPGALYDRILATGSTRTIPLPWLEQIRPGGIILMNLIGEMGACMFLKLVKQETRLAAGGRFLSRSEFMELHEAGSYPHRRGALVGYYLAREVSMRATFSRADFDLSVLWERTLDFALQLAFPQMSFASAYANPPCPCLIDRASDTMLLLRPTGGEEFQVEVRGDPQVWEQVKVTYHQWIACGRPDVTAYHVQVDPCGKQRIVLPTFAGSTGTAEWVLSEGEA